MIDTFRYKWQMWRLQKAQWELDRKYRQAPDDPANELGLQLDEIENEVMLIRSSYLVGTAKKLFIPVPDMDIAAGKWVRARDADGRLCLSLEAQNELSSAIRKERIAQSERLRLLLAGVTGLIGAVTGLAALLLKH